MEKPHSKDQPDGPGLKNKSILPSITKPHSLQISNLFASFDETAIYLVHETAVKRNCSVALCDSDSSV